MAASPTQIQARWRKSAFHKTSSYKDSCRKSRISLHQAMRLRFTGKHGVRQCHTAYSQNHTSKHRFRHRTIPHCMRKAHSTLISGMKYPTADHTRQSQRQQQHQFVRANFYRIKSRQTRVFTKQLAQNQKCTQSSHNSAQIHDGLLGFWKSDVLFSACTISRPGKRSHKTIKRCSKQRSKRRLGAGNGKSPEVSAELTHPVSHPSAKPCDDSRKASFGPYTSPKQQRQQSS